MNALVKYLDSDKDGCVSYQEFVKGMVVPLSTRKALMVELAWSQFAGKGDSEATVGDIKNEGFVGELGMAADAKLSREDFDLYYSDVACVCPDDDYFVRCVEQQWNVKESGAASVTHSNIQHVLDQLRQRLRCVANGSQDEFVLKKLFSDFDTDKSGKLSGAELAGLCARLGLKFEQRHLDAVMKVVDTDNNGCIEFNEFCNFVVNDRYK